ncbi:MAG TPA: DUF1580 domain-containing protein [Isosphaeraceae bacterium]|nr:DUF1580 domain-containing protein [Isosphaeraceae bacterium]
MQHLSQTEWIPIRDVATLPQVTPCGKPLHPSTPARWAVYGIGGTRLESQKIAGRRYTSPAAVERFIARCAQATCPQHQDAIDSLALSPDSTHRRPDLDHD